MPNAISIVKPGSRETDQLHRSSW